ncbi:MAG: glycosyltransferase family 4 protein, partial [Anaerolineales bacterium]|nr:glycosyltransferase family 4 protein [Anaerolineales bacterium]
ERNIALLHYTAPPVVGGVESVLGHHARLMSSNGSQVRIIAGRGEPLDGQVPFYSIPLADSKHPDILAAKQSLDIGVVPDNFTHMVAALEEELLTALEGVEVVIAHNVCSLHKNLALTAALQQVCSRPQAPFLIPWHHDLAWIVPRYDGELHPGWPWDLLRGKWENTRARHVTVSEGRRHELVDLFELAPADIEVVPSGLDLARFFKLDQETVGLVKKLGLVDADLILLLPVRITRRKNIELAVHTMAALAPRFPQAALIVTGPPGPHNPKNKHYLEELLELRRELKLEPGGEAGPAVHFMADIVPHYLPDAVIADFYRLADVLILPSREEGFGIPLIEAGLAGLPIFSADIPILRELVNDHAYFFPPDGDPEAVAGLIIETVERLPGVSLKSKVRREYTWDGVYKRKIDPLLAQVGEGSTD